jgi:hypothetical protein
VIAQAAIACTVKDASGAVLPGVTVEAASPRSSKKYGLWTPMASVRIALSIYDRATMR